MANSLVKRGFLLLVLSLVVIISGCITGSSSGDTGYSNTNMWGQQQGYTTTTTESPREKLLYTSVISIEPY
ncbi:hypothetical protein [Thermococcus sp. GR7]|uniref:hypothetical protein n=1 Tax=Thermococcus sp. GR7 TaxID=1638257 RepID=UPI0014309230|nr:hypothetical protein [Thermococcus sp. GR7]